jgi:hypothetical protein
LPCVGYQIPNMDDEPPNLDDSDKALVAGLLRRTAKSQHIRDEAKRIGGEIEKIRLDASQINSSTRKAFSAFGFKAEGDIWPAVKAAIGSVAWDDAVQSGFVAGRESPELKAISNLLAPTKPALGPPNPAVNSPEQEVMKPESGHKKDMPPVREVVLGELERAGELGLKASDIRRFILHEYNRDLHEKTVGMTLYRLSQQGRVSRDGRIWLFVPQTGTKDPGAGTPGQTSTVSEEGGQDGSHPTHNT